MQPIYHFIVRRVGVLVILINSLLPLTIFAANSPNDSTAITPRLNQAKMVLCPVAPDTNLAKDHCVVVRIANDTNRNSPRRVYSYGDANHEVGNITFTTNTNISNLSCNNQGEYSLFRGILDYNMQQRFNVTSLASSGGVHDMKGSVSYLCCRPQTRWLPEDQCQSLKDALPPRP
jgi:hypothetical protein